MAESASLLAEAGHRFVVTGPRVGVAAIETLELLRRQSQLLPYAVIVEPGAAGLASKIRLPLNVVGTTRRRVGDGAEAEPGFGVPACPKATFQQPATTAAWARKEVDRFMTCLPDKNTDTALRGCAGVAECELWRRQGRNRHAGAETARNDLQRLPERADAELPLRRGRPACWPAERSGELEADRTDVTAEAERQLERAERSVRRTGCRDRFANPQSGSQASRLAVGGTIWSRSARIAAAVSTLPRPPEQVPNGPFQAESAGPCPSLAGRVAEGRPQSAPSLLSFSRVAVPWRLMRSTGIPVIRASTAPGRRSFSRAMASRTVWPVASSESMPAVSLRRIPPPHAARGAAPRDRAAERRSRTRAAAPRRRGSRSGPGRTAGPRSPGRWQSGAVTPIRR